MEQNSEGSSDASGGGHATDGFLAPLAAAVASLPDRSVLRTLSSDDVVAYAQGLELHANQIFAASLAALADIDERGLPAQLGPMSLGRFLAPALRLSDAEARRRIRAMRALEPTAAVSGAVIPPVLCRTAAALAEGAISAAHVEVIATIMNRLPRDFPVSDRDEAEDILVTAARNLPPTAVLGLGRRLIDTVDPDGTDPEEDEARHARKRGLWLRQLDDSSFELKARLTPELGAKLRALIEYLAAPVNQKKVRAAEDAARADGDGSATDADLVQGLADGWDPRSACQRHLDALAEIIDTFMAGGSINPLDVEEHATQRGTTPDGSAAPNGSAGPDGSAGPEAPRGTDAADAVEADDVPADGTGEADFGAGTGAAGDGADDRDHSDATANDSASRNDGGAAGRADPPNPGTVRRPNPPTLVLHGSVIDFAANVGTAHTTSGDQIPMWAARRIVADQASIFAVTLDTTGCVLDEARKKRLATRNQLAAVVARDRGCTIRGCDRPISRCQIHHVISWLDQGETNVDNLVALCFWHHRWFKQLGYACTMVGGVPYWTPPPWIDPAQTPRRHERFDTFSGRAA